MNANPQRAVGERVAESGNDRARARRVELADWQPVGREPARRKALGERHEVFAGVEIDHARDHGRWRLRGDDVELLAPRAQVVTAVFPHEAHARILQRVAVPVDDAARGEDLRRNVDHRELRQPWLAQ